MGEFVIPIGRYIKEAKILELDDNSTRVQKISGLEDKSETDKMIKIKLI